MLLLSARQVSSEASCLVALLRLVCEASLRAGGGDDNDNGDGGQQEEGRRTRCIDCLYLHSSDLPLALVRDEVVPLLTGLPWPHPPPVAAGDAGGGGRGGGGGGSAAAVGPGLAGLPPLHLPAAGGGGGGGGSGVVAAAARASPPALDMLLTSMSREKSEEWWGGFLAALPGCFAHVKVRCAFAGIRICLGTSAGRELSCRVHQMVCVELCVW